MNREDWIKSYDLDFKSKFNNHKRKKEYDEIILKRIQNKSKVLVVGCGAGDFCIELEKKDCDVTAIDCSNEVIEYCKLSYFNSKVKFIQMFAEDVASLNDYFDVVVLSEVLEHVEFPFFVLSECEKISDNIIIDVPFRNRADDNMHIHYFDFEPVDLIGFTNPVFEIMEYRRKLR